jgi:hypothetical protein
MNDHLRLLRVTGTVVGLFLALAGIAFIRYASDTPANAIAMNRVAAGLVLGVPLSILGLGIAVGASLGRMTLGLIGGFVLGPGLTFGYLIWTAR